MITKRNYSVCEGDYLKVKMFLRENYEEYCKNGFWFETQWEYTNVVPWYNYCSSHRMALWEENQKIVAISTYAWQLGEAHFFIKDGYEYLRDEMLEHAEKKLSIKNTEGKMQLLIKTVSNQLEMHKFFENSGYKKEEYETIYNILELTDELPIPEIPEGYKIILLNQVAEHDYKKVNNMIWQGFDNIGEGHFEGFLMTMNAPTFRKDLTYIVEAENGDFCAYGSIWYNEISKYGYLEPLCTHPDHRKRGLAKAIIYTAANDIAKLGGTYMTGGEDKFYQKIGYREKYRFLWYKKTW